MSPLCRSNFRRLALAAAAIVTPYAAIAQSEVQLRVRQQAGWDARAREGRCEIRVWVDNRAEVRMRGDQIFVRTTEGSRGRDEGSQCSQPIPYNSVRGFQVRQTAGRSRVDLAQEPSRMNNYTAMIAINDNQGGGDNYAFEVTWLADADVAMAPAPFFDDVRACQDAVRQSFQGQNGRGSYIDFSGFADRRGENPDRGMDRNAKRNQGRNPSRESIQGRGNARRPYEARDLTYSCDIDTRLNRVLTATYRYDGAALRTNGRPDDRRQLR